MSKRHLKIGIRRKNLFVSLSCILVAFFATLLHGYSALIFDVFPLTYKINMFPRHIQDPIFLLLPYSFPYFFISLILFVTLEISIVYAVIIPVFSFFIEDLYFYYFSGMFILFGNQNITFPKIIILFIATILSILGALIGKSMKKVILKNKK